MRNICFYISAIILAFAYVSCSKDSPSSEQKDNFIKFYGDANKHYPSDIVKYENSYYMLINYTNDDKEWFYVQNVDEYGNTINKKEFISQGGENQKANGMCRLANGNVAITGYVQTDEETFHSDIFLMVIGPDLSIISDTIYNDTAKEKGFIVAERPDEELFIYGTQKMVNSETIFRISLPIDNQLNVVMTERNGTTDDEYVGKALISEQNEILISGRGWNYTEFRADLSHYGSNGRLVAPPIAGINGHYSEALFLNQTQIIICGKNFNGTLGDNDAYVALYDVGERTMIWEKDFGGIYDDEATCAVINSNNEIIVAGKKSNTSSSSDLFVFKLDIDGNLLDEIYLGGTAVESAVSIFADENNSNVFTVFGMSDKGDEDEPGSVILIKTSF